MTTLVRQIVIAVTAMVVAQLVIEKIRKKACSC
jgi:hypothetical protein